VVTRWVRLNGRKNSSLSVEPIKDANGNVVQYRIWSGDCPRPDSPFKIDAATLRELGYKPEDE